MIKFFLFSAAILAIAAALYWRWSTRTRAEIAEAAAEAFERLNREDTDLLRNYDAQSFARIFERVHFPRFPLYALISAAGFLVALPFMFMLMSLVLNLAQASGFYGDAGALADRVPLRGDAATIEQRRVVVMYLIETYSGVIYLFGVLLLWGGVVTLAMRRYHARRPGYLHEELALNRPKDL
jgi:hypothetical protein